MKTQLLYSNEFQSHDDITHPENAKRLVVMMQEIKKSPLFEKIEIIQPTLLDEDLLYDVHTKNMIDRVKEASLKESSWLDPDTYICKGDYDIARLAAGGLVDITENVINDRARNGFALVRPPGHHATRDRSMGFCLFNNIAIAANMASKKGKRVLIFDLDVHHGNGTQDIFYNRKDVMYQSFHLSPHYPGTGDTDEIGEGEGIGYNVNTPLNYGNGDNAITQLLDEVFLPITKQFKPDILLVSCGYDSHHADILGGLSLSVNFFGEIISRFQKIQPKIVCTLEGGYNLDWIGKCLVSQLGQLLLNPIKIEDYPDEKKDVEYVLNRIKNEMSGFWKI
ncbi:MAG: histone deacetylase [Candidatus Thermoplasmatota archaeon]|nr:histone deacetylase [Candidatus Thermoplasmatota archaeon]